MTTTSKTNTEEKDPVSGCLAAIGGTVLVIPLMVLLEIYYGLILRTIYAWIICPIYHLPTITIPQAIGLMAFVSLFMPGHKTRKDEKEAINWSYTLASLIIYKPTLALGIAYIAHLYIR